MAFAAPAVGPPRFVGPDAASTASSDGSPDEGPDETVAIDAVVLRLEGLDAVAFTDAMTLRSPDRLVSPDARQAAAGGRRFAFIDVRGEADGSVMLSIVVSDGTAYFRTVDMADTRSADDRVRVAAATLANLLAAIEESRVEPDAVDVPIPDEDPAEDPPDPPPPDPPPPDPPPEASPLPESTLSMWIDGAPAVVLAVGPPTPVGLAALGGQLSLDLRHTSGGMGGIAVRGAGRRLEDYLAARTRISVGGGFGRTFGRFDLTAALYVDAEPLWVSVAGERESIVEPGGQARRTVWSLGGHARLGAAWAPKLAAPSRPGQADGWVRLRVGPVVEVSGSGLSGGGVARLQRPASAGGGVTDLVRAGGLEVTLLLGVGVGFSLPASP